MTRTREQMIDRVIRRYGFEARETIMFCKLCESVYTKDENIEIVYNHLMR